MTDPAEQLERFLVGGAVRDQLLGEPISDRDWIVIGATAERMEKLGFRSVGRDFPVFLHPITGEEYALARRERKVGAGYRGFEIDSSPNVTLEEDLERRDLTINAMARSPDGALIDPFGGAADLQAGRLRHVSLAFVEDPVRVLRVARFGARFASRGFEIATETKRLIVAMVQNGEVDTLVAERVWRELELALGEDHPSVFFEVLRQSGALARILPELDVLFGIPQPENHHPEGDVGTHMLIALEEAVKLSRDTRVRFAALVYEVGKGTTPQHKGPRQIAHEKRGVRQVKALCQRLRVPHGHRDLALAVTEYHLLMHKLHELRTTTVLKLLYTVNAFRARDNIKPFVLACQADANGRGCPRQPYPAAQLLALYAEAARDVDLNDLEASLPDGEARGREARRRRLAAIANVRSIWRASHLMATTSAKPDKKPSP
jgi:tRNA nucleotidyltransferase (CCA-adding enzyme)